MFGLFSSAKTVDKAVDLIDSTVRGVGTWIDERDFTAEERSEAQQKMLEFKLTVLERTSTESSARSISRRILAWSVTYVFLGLLLLATLGFILKATWAAQVLSVAKLLNNAFWTIIGFYFVAHIGNGWIEKMKKE
jgi:hypothetical protein